VRTTRALLDALMGGGADLASAAPVLAEELEADGVIVLVATPDERELVAAAVHPPAPGVAEELRVPYGTGVTGAVATNGHAITLDEDVPRTPALREILGIAEGGTVSRMCVPSHGLDGDVLGVVSWHRRPGRPFTADELARGRVVGDLVGLRLLADRLTSDVRAHRSERDTLIAHAISAQEGERRRIAGDLHDGVSQALVSLGYHLEAASGSLADVPGAEVARRRIASALELSRMAYDETRAAISGLHSLVLEDLGLVAALESLAASVPQLTVDFRHPEDDDFSVVPDHVAAALYRIAQESLQNAVKHSGATRVVLSLRRAGDRVVLGVSDDGVGFDVRARPVPGGEAYGLGSVAERCALIGAELRIESWSGRGTAVIVDCPL
jgi:two-component system NarL family sensor kinase